MIGGVAEGHVYCFIVGVMVKEDYEEECVGRWKAPKVRDGAKKVTLSNGKYRFCLSTHLVISSDHIQKRQTDIPISVPKGVKHIVERSISHAAGLTYGSSAAVHLEIFFFGSIGPWPWQLQWW